MPAQSGIPGMLALLLITLVGLDASPPLQVQDGSITQMHAATNGAWASADHGATPTCPSLDEAQAQLRGAAGEPDLVVSAGSPALALQAGDADLFQCRYETRSSHGNDRHWLAMARVEANGSRVLHWNGPL